MGIHHSPHTHPIPTGIPMGITIPTAALAFMVTAALTRKHEYWVILFDN